MIRGEFPSYGWDERIWCANLKPPRLHGSYVSFVVDQGQIGWKWWVPQFLRLGLWLRLTIWSNLSICKLCAGIIFASFARFPKREILSVTSKPSVGLYCDDPIVFNDAYECILHFSKNNVIRNQNPAIFVFVCNFSVLIWSKRFTENLRCWPGPNCFGV